MPKSNKNIPVYKIKTKKMDPFGFDILDLSGKDGRIYDSQTPHRHTFFELFFFEAGKGEHEIDFKVHPVEAGSVHFVSPGQIHQLSLKNTKGYVLCFTEDFTSLRTRGSFTENFPFYESQDTATLKLNPELVKEILILLKTIAREAKLVSDQQAELVSAYLNIVLLRLKTYFLNQVSKDEKTISKKGQVMRFKKMINDAFLHHKKVSGYAHALKLSPNYLNALCKKYEGKTAILMIQERLLLESKRLLYATDMDVKEISFRLNFQEVSYYNRFFKKHTQLTPVQYREQSRKNH